MYNQPSLRTDEPRAGYYDRRPRDIFANQGAGLLNFNKIPADVLAAMRHIGRSYRPDDQEDD